MTTASLSLSVGRRQDLVGSAGLGWGVLGLVVVILVGSMVAWDTPFFWSVSKPWQPIVSLTSLAYVAAFAAVVQISRFPMAFGPGALIISVLVAHLSSLSIILFGRFYYSRSFLLGSVLINLAWALIGFRHWGRRPELMSLSIVPGGFATELKSLSISRWTQLEGPKLPARIDGVVIDLHQKLSPEWIRLLADCSLSGLPIFHAAALYEVLTGRVSVRHVSDGVAIAEFKLPVLYVFLKRALDILLILVTMPLSLPLMMLAAIAIKLESPGPVLFWQDRMGQGGRPFRMVKFRSMRIDAESKGSQFASLKDSRVTRVGRFLRRFRIDELPQFWNILRGEMSLIGPRPEQVSFSRKFVDEISCYGYRHLVKPGLTGWAQVSQGYAADFEGTRRKLEYDLYYVKHLAFSLDLFILMKTVRTLLTGFGSR